VFVHSAVMDGMGLSLWETDEVDITSANDVSDVSDVSAVEKSTNRT
jgi:hypothetical protein